MVADAPEGTKCARCGSPWNGNGSYAHEDPLDDESPVVRVWCRACTDARSKERGARRNPWPITTTRDKTVRHYWRCNVPGCTRSGEQSGHGPGGAIALVRSFHIVPHWEAYHEAQAHSGPDDTCAECAELGRPESIPVARRLPEDVAGIMKLDKRHGERLKTIFSATSDRFVAFATMTLAQRQAKAQKRYEKMCAPTPEPTRTVRRRKR